MKPSTPVLLASLVLALPAAAQHKADDHAAHRSTSGTQANASVAAVLTDGEVRKVDKAAARITLKHAEIKNLDMPPMTMVFSVRDKALLDAVKAGDKVKFKAISDDGKLTVTEIQLAR